MRAAKGREGGCVEYSGGQCEVAVTNEDVAWSTTLRMMVLAEEVRCERQSRKKKEWLEVGRKTLECPRRPGSVNNERWICAYTLSWEMGTNKNMKSYHRRASLQLESFSHHPAPSSTSVAAVHERKAQTMEGEACTD
jgi:hypothetical protein